MLSELSLLDFGGSAAKVSTRVCCMISNNCMPAFLFLFYSLAVELFLPFLSVLGYYQSCITFFLGKKQMLNVSSMDGLEFP